MSESEEMDPEVSESEIPKSQEENSKIPSSGPVDNVLSSPDEEKTSTVSPSSREDANFLSLANSQSIDDAEEKTESHDESDEVTENETALGNAKGPPEAAEVIELLDDDDTGDAEVDAINSQPDLKRQRTATDAAQASLESRNASMPDWMLKAAQGQTRLPVPAPPPIASTFGEPSYLPSMPNFMTTWRNVLPAPQQPAAVAPGRQKLKTYRLSLLNVSEFTIIGTQPDAFSQPTSLKGLRSTIKSIAREQGGKAYVKRDEDDEQDQGKWHIPLSCYQNFYSYLKQLPMHHVEGISEVQLKIASLGKAQLEKEYPSPGKLVREGVPPRLAKALAPFQRGGVDFVLDKEGRALIADEMGLGKSIQSIAAMAVYHEEWPLLVLCPSSARYHWENEFRHWLGEDSTIDSSTDVFDAEKGEGATNEDTEGEEKKDAADGAIPVPKQPMKFLKSSQINVLGSGSDALLPKDTRVVICSYGLAPNLVKNEMIGNGMFQCAIVDESHMLKNKSTQRTKSLLPILKDTKRCILLSGTPALSKPMELWPQLTILGAGKHGWWQDEARFVSKYVRNVSTHRRAELHTLLTGTVMIRRMKNDILKTLPPKVREMARVDVMPDNVRGEMQELMVVLRQGKGKLGEYARQYSANEESTDFMAPPETPAPAGQETQESADQGGQPPVMNQQQLAAAHQQLQQEIQERYNNGIASIQHTIQTTQHQLGQAGIVELMDDMQNRLKQEIEVFQRERMHQIQQQFMLGTPGAVVPSSPVGTDSSARKATLNRMYCLTGEVKVPLIVDMLKRWLDDPTKGKLCIFAHHIAVLDTIAKEAGLSSASDSTRKYIRIDGSTSPRARQECINTFQSDTSVRVALLGITAAGVAVTLTASATVWFAELFWTPALMIQAEDRCHRIGQNSQVKCLYFVAKGTLDELLWKLVERKFQDLGEFVEGKEKLKMVVNKSYESVEDIQATLVPKEIEPDEEDDYETDADQRRAKTSSPLDLDLSIEHDIEELGLSEMAMVKAFEVDDDDGEAGDKSQSSSRPTVTTILDDEPTETIEGQTENDAICLLDDDEEEAVQQTTGSASAAGAASDTSAAPTQNPDATESSKDTAAVEADQQPPQHWIDYPLRDPRYYKINFTGSSYGITMTPLHGRIVVQGNGRGPGVKPSFGDVILSVNGTVLLPNQNLQLLSAEMKRLISLGPVQLMLLESPTIVEMLKINMQRVKQAEEQRAMASAAHANPVAYNGEAPQQQPVANGSNGGATAASVVPQQETKHIGASGSQEDEVIELLDD